MQDADQPTQDGGKSSDLKELSLSTKRVKLWIFLEELIMRIETSFSTISTERLTSNGTSSMLMSGRENQLRENSTKTLVFMLRETSMLFHNFHQTDTLT
jgi:hypothetical protein